MAKKKEEKKEVKEEKVKEEIKEDLPYTLVRMREENKGD
jgi:hypothetical protein